MDFYVLKKVIKLAAIHFLRLSLLQARKNYHINQKGINAIKRIISIILIFVFSFMFSATAFAETGISGTCTYVDFYDSSSHGANNGNVGVSYSAYTIPAYHNCTLIIKIIEIKLMDLQHTKYLKLDIVIPFLDITVSPDFLSILE